MRRQRGRGSPAPPLTRQRLAHYPVGAIIAGAVAAA